MPKAFSEVPKRIYSAGRKEINRLKNQRRELLVNLKDLKDKNRLLMKEKHLMNRLLREYQGEGEPYAVLMKEHRDEIKSMKNALSSLRQEFYEEQMYQGEVDAEIFSCNNQLSRCKELLEREKKTESMLTLTEKLHTSGKKANNLAEQIEMHGIRISELTEQCKLESRQEEVELKLLQEKLRTELERLAQLNSDFKSVTKKLGNVNHHHHHPEGNGMRVNKPETSVNHLGLPKSQSIRKKVRVDLSSSNCETLQSLNFSLDSEVDQTSTPKATEKDKKRIPSPKSKHGLISPTIGVSYGGPLTSLKTSDEVTSDLGRSVGTSADGVSEDVWNRWDANVNSDSTQDDNQKMNSFLSRDAGYPKTPHLFMDDTEGTEEDCLSSGTGSITDSSSSSSSSSSNTTIIKTNNEVVNESKDDIMVDSFNSLNITKDIKLKKFTDLASQSNQDQHRNCCGDRPSHRRPPEKKCQLLSRRKNSLFQIKARPRKVYVFDKTVEYLHRGHPTRVQRA